MVVNENPYNTIFRKSLMTLAEQFPNIDDNFINTLLSLYKFEIKSREYNEHLLKHLINLILDSITPNEPKVNLFTVVKTLDKLIDKFEILKSNESINDRINELKSHIK